MSDHASQLSHHTEDSGSVSEEEEKEVVHDTVESQTEESHRDVTPLAWSQQNPHLTNESTTQEEQAFPPTPPDRTHENRPQTKDFSAQKAQSFTLKPAQHSKMGISEDEKCQLEEHNPDLPELDKKSLSALNRCLYIGKRIVPFAVYMCGIVVIVLYGIILGGSSSPGMSDLFLVSAHNLDHTLIKSTANSNETTYFADDVSIRIGYFGMCTSSPSMPLTCMNTRSKDGTTLSKAFLPNNDLSTVTLYDFAFHIQTNVFTLLSVASGIFFLISFLGLIYLQIILARDHKESQCKNNKRWFKWVVWGSMALTIAVAAGSQQAADALEWVGDNGMGRLDIKSGGTLLGLQWVIVTFSVFFALGSSWIYNGKVKYKPKKDINASQY